MPNQGVYAAFVQSACSQTEVYIGSSYGQQGMKNGILKNHLNPHYRSKDPFKALYIAMDKPGTTTSFVSLLNYEKRVPIGAVLLAEAMCASLFGSFDSEQYRKVRLRDLPEVNWEYGLNRSDPLRSLPTGPESIGNDVTTYRRLRTLDNCLKSGPMRVGFHPRRKHAMNGSYQFCLFKENFTIPKDVAFSWKLNDQSEINVQWQCYPERHPHAFAPMARENDDGKRVGIRVFMISDGIEHEHWIVRNTPGAVLLANTLHDFLNGQIVGKDYKWTESRRHIFQGVEREDSEDTEGERTGNRARVGIPYHNKDFIWDDGQRQPETKPADTSTEAFGGATSSPRYDDNLVDDKGIAIGYEEWVEEMNEKYLYPNHRELRRQGGIISLEKCEYLV